VQQLRSRNCQAFNLDKICWSFSASLFPVLFSLCNFPKNPDLSLRWPRHSHELALTINVAANLRAFGAVIATVMAGIEDWLDLFLGCRKEMVPQVRSDPRISVPQTIRPSAIPKPCNQGQTGHRGSAKASTIVGGQAAKRSFELVIGENLQSEIVEIPIMIGI
jgi:hypothetical protein